MIILIVVKSF